MQGPQTPRPGGLIPALKEVPLTPPAQTSPAPPFLPKVIPRLAGGPHRPQALQATAAPGSADSQSLEESSEEGRAPCVSLIIERIRMGKSARTWNWRLVALKEKCQHRRRPADPRAERSSEKTGPAGGEGLRGSASAGDGRPGGVGQGGVRAGGALRRRKPAARCRGPPRNRG